MGVPRFEPFLHLPVLCNGCSSTAEDLTIKGELRRPPPVFLHVPRKGFAQPRERICGSEPQDPPGLGDVNGEVDLDIEAHPEVKGG